MVRVSPYAAVGEAPITEVRWDAGFWGDRVAQLASTAIPSMWTRVLNDPSVGHAFANFRIAAGLEEGRHAGPPFFDGDLYKWLEAAASTYAATRDAELERLMAEVVPVIALAQRADGYLHTPVLIAQRRADGSVRELSDRLHFEVYNLGHLMTAACRHHIATGSDELLAVARRAADYLRGYFADPTPERAKNSICPSHYMGLVDLGRATGEAAYVRLAASLIDMRSLIRDGTDDNQDRIPFRQQRKAVGHAVRANYLYAGAADVLAETGDETLREPLEAIWADVTGTKLLVTGGAGVLYDGVSPDGADDHDAIQRVHQAYGRPYQLPALTAYDETCANIGNALWNWRMFKLTGEARFLEVVETVLYNSMLVGISLDGTRFSYRNALRQVDDLPFHLRWSRTRERFITSYCCPPNVLRTIAASATWAYGASDAGAWVNLYGSSTLDTTLPGGEPLRVVQRTGYPWDGAVEITVERAPARPLALHLRIPAWAHGASIRMNSRPAGVDAVPGAFARIERAWSAGDRLELDLPMRPRLLVAHPLAEEIRNQVAVARGPVVYCLESKDLPGGVRVSDIVMPSDVALRESRGTGPFGGMVLLSARALRHEVEGGPQRELYRTLGRHALRRQDVTMIPYFAWDNRGLSEMSTWLPVRWA